MKKIFCYSFLCCLYLNLAAQAKYSKVDQMAEQLLKTARLPAISIAVSQKGEIIYAKSFGMGDVEKKIPATLTTRFRTASVAKVITATAIGRLVSERRLDLDAPIKTYIPYISEHMAAISSRQLLGQISGVRHRPPKRKNKTYSTKDAVALFKQTPLLFPPGSDYKYSTNGFTLLAAAIEGITGQSYLEYMDQEIFKPLKMTNTKGEQPETLDSQDAKLYTIKKGKLKADKFLNNPSYKMAGAGFRTTPTDLVKMMNGYSNGFLKEQVVKEMFSSQQLKDGSPTRVGLTWRMNVDPFGRRVVDHAGNWQGARTVVIYYPKEKLSVAIMVNARWDGLIEETAQMIAAVFLNKSTTVTNANHFNGKVNATFHTVQNESEFNGNLILKNGVGELRFDTEIEFLKHVPLMPLGENHYAAFTSFGILYLKIENQEKLSGRLYWYQNRNHENPTNGQAILSFEGL